MDVREYVEEVNLITNAIIRGSKVYNLKRTKEMINLPQVSDNQDYASKLKDAKLLARIIIRQRMPL